MADDKCEKCKPVVVEVKTVTAPVCHFCGLPITDNNYWNKKSHNACKKCRPDGFLPEDTL